MLCNFFKGLFCKEASFAWWEFFPRRPPIYEHSSRVYHVLDPSSFALNYCGFMHVKVCNNLVQDLMGNSPDRRSNVILERINSLGLLPP